MCIRDSYKGVIGTGRIKRGVAKVGMPLAVVAADGEIRKGKMGEIFGYHGLERINVDEAKAGDIIAFSGLDPLHTLIPCVIQNTQSTYLR